MTERERGREKAVEMKIAQALKMRHISVPYQPHHQIIEGTEHVVLAASSSIVMVKYE